MDDTDYVEVLWDEGVPCSDSIDKEVLRRFILLNCRDCERGRQYERSIGMPPSGYELEDWFIDG